MTYSDKNNQPNSYKITINKTGRFADICFLGGVTKEELDQTFMSLIEHPDFFYNINALYDYSDAYPDIEMSDIEEHSQYVAEHLYIRGKNYKLAMVANDTLSRALLQVYKLLISKTPVEAEVFSRRKDAIYWLLSEE